MLKIGNRKKLKVARNRKKCSETGENLILKTEEKIHKCLETEDNKMLAEAQGKKSPGATLGSGIRK